MPPDRSRSSITDPAGNGLPSRPGAPDDHTLVQRLKAGDEQAFSALVARYRPTMLRVARSYVSTDAVAEEVVQEAWLGLLKGLATFEARSSVKTWLFRILVNRAMTRGQREARALPFSSLGDPSEDEGPTVSAERFGRDGAWATPPRPFELPERRTELLELRSELRAALAALPARQRIVVTLHDVEGMSTEEVGEALGLTANNVRVLLHRARARLQAGLAEYMSSDAISSNEAAGQKDNGE
jgi:RNA polymerase sigma-70 factor (ECF subfamily)